VDDRNSRGAAELGAERSFKPGQVMQFNPSFHELRRRSKRYFSTIHGLQIEPAEP